jgi:hypothetical protein
MEALEIGLRALLLAALILALFMTARANSRLQAKRDRSRSIFSPMHTIDALKTKEAYILLIWVLITINLVIVLMSISPNVK